MSLDHQQKSLCPETNNNAVSLTCGEVGDLSQATNIVTDSNKHKKGISIYQANYISLRATVDSSTAKDQINMKDVDPQQG